MNQAPITETIPIEADTDGRLRVSGTRVLLDVIVIAYHQGASPEHIVQMYPTLRPDQVYLALGYYLRHRALVDEYLQRMDAEAEQLRLRWESANPPNPSRAELLARLADRRDAADRP